MRRKHPSKRQRQQRREEQMLDLPMARVKTTYKFLFHTFSKLRSSKLHSLRQAEELLEEMLDWGYVPYRIEYVGDQVYHIELQRRQGLYRRRWSVDGIAYTIFSRWATRAVQQLGLTKHPKVKIVRKPLPTKASKAL